MSATKPETMGLLSKKDIPLRERLIVALDMPSVQDAQALVTKLGDSVQFYKVGLSLIFDDQVWRLFDWLVSQGKKAFADIKLYDIPETVEASVRKLVGRKITFATVHAHEQMIRAAVRGRGERTDPKILAVTVLTSLDRADFLGQGLSDSQIDDRFIERLVLSRARRMLEVGSDGVISSGIEVARLRQEFGENFLVVVPGIRPVANTDDHQRSVNVEEAFLNGADYIVVGRPIRNAEQPREAAEAIQARIAGVFT